MFGRVSAKQRRTRDNEIARCEYAFRIFQRPFRRADQDSYPMPFGEMELHIAESSRHNRDETQRRHRLFKNS